MAKAVKTIQGCSLPGAESRQAWKFSALGKPETVPEAELDTEQCAYGFAAKETISEPMWVNTADPELLAQVVRMELEQKKLDVATDAGSLFHFEVVAEDGPRRQVLASVLTPEALENLPSDVDWARYDLAAQDFSFPADAMTFYRENGEWTVAYSKGEKLAYVHPLGPFDLDEDMLLEAHCLHLRLLEQNLVAGNLMVHLWDPRPETNEMAQRVERYFGVPLTRSEAPSPDASRRMASTLFEPPEVARRRLRRERKAKVVRLLSGVIAIYGVFVLAGWLYLFQRERRLESREAQVKVLLPHAERIQGVQNTWDELRQAVDPNRYPLEIFYQCAQLLPSRGVRLTHFEISGPRIEIRGEASTTAQAIQFRNALLNAESLAYYEWESPKPEILPDGRAKFRASGITRTTPVPTT